MFSVSEIQESPEFKNISMFKAWWDILMDYLVAATALNVLLLLTRIASVDTGGLICVHPLQGFSYGYVESRYVNSRCCSESNAWIVIFHPYLMLFMWMCITACHICWIKIPSINTKMEAFYVILYRIFTTQPKFYRSPTSLRMTTELSYNEANQKAIDILLNKLLYLMTEKPFLRFSYIIKHSIIIGLCFVSVCHALVVIGFLHDYPSSFSCYLKHNPPTMRGYPFQNSTLIGSPCHLNIGPFIYVLIHVDALIRIIMIGLSIKGVMWSVQSQRVKRNKISNKRDVVNDSNQPSEVNKSQEAVINKDDDSPFGEAAEYLSGMPSYPDLLFCINLLKRNVHDGHLMYEAICTSIKNYVKKLKSLGEKYKKKVQEEHKLPGKYQNVERPSGYQPKSFYEFIAHVKWISRELGLEWVPNSMDSDNLFNALLYIKNSLGLVDLCIEVSMRDLIVKHLRRHPELYKTLIDEDPDFDSFEAHCEKLANPNFYGSFYAVQAASTLLNVKIIIIHCESTVKIPEVFLPLRHNLLLTGNIRSCINNENVKGSHSNIATRFLAYVAPHYFYATIDMPVSRDWPHIVSRRMNYSVDRKYRSDMRQLAIRSVIIQNEYISHPDDKT